MTDQLTQKHIDVFNGDADGICALHQLRMADPRPAAALVTGVKRDIRLLEKLTGTENALITVLDISMETNRHPLENLLVANRVVYIDHHYAGEPPDSPNLEAHIDPDPEICTALIVDRLLNGRFRDWAIIGAYGDNLHQAARQTAAGTRLNERELAILRELGELLNYNGYGRSIEDLHFHPAALFNSLKNYRNPLDLWHSSPELNKLRQGFKSDMEKARRIEPYREGKTGRIFRFPEAAWCRRVAGVFINEKARDREDLAHALLIDNGDGTSMASIRAPLANRTGADRLCRAFPTGGGRAAAAGINRLPNEMLNQFFNEFDEVFR
jgi:single-stranded DNA-specific DHH superfamily exonuclease